MFNAKDMSSTNKTTVFYLSNPFRVWLFWGNLKKIFAFSTILRHARWQTDEFLPCGRHGTLYRAWPIAGNLMTWWWCGALMVRLMLVGTIELPVIWYGSAFIWHHCNDRQKYTALQWRHNGPHGVSNHQPHHCLLKRLFGRRSKKTSKLRVTSLCAGNSPGSGEFPAQRASKAGNVFIWWRHHGIGTFAATFNTLLLKCDKVFKSVIPMVFKHGHLINAFSRLLNISIFHFLGQ